MFSRTEKETAGMSENRDDIRYYIIAPDCNLRGWKLLPYALQSGWRQKTMFFRKPEFELLKKCDGRTAIAWNELSESEQNLLEVWQRDGLVRPSGGNDWLLPDQEYQFYPNAFKEHVQWSITGKCNFRCRHCFMSAPHAAEGEPTFEELMQMLEAFDRCGIRSVSLTGGEPLIRRDFWQLVDAILARGINIRYIYSNGFLVTDAFLDELDKRHIRPSIQFSFDGIGTHDWMRGIDGAEQFVRDALKRCQERGFQTSCSMVLFRENTGTIRESVKLLASLGVGSLKIGNAMPQGEWVNETEHFLTQAEANQVFLDYIPQYFEDGAPLSIGLEGFFSYNKYRNKISALFERGVSEENFSKAPMCLQVKREMYVSPKGVVMPCMSMVGTEIEKRFPNMLETPLEEILNHLSIYMILSDSRISDFMAHHPDCAECRYRADCCGGCRAWAVRDGSTDFLAKDMVTCEYYLGGWKEKKEAVLKQLGLM